MVIGLFCLGVLVLAVLNWISIALNIEMEQLLNFLGYCALALGAVGIILAFRYSNSKEAQEERERTAKEDAIAEEVMRDLYKKIRVVELSEERTKKHWLLYLKHCDGLVLNYDYLYNSFYVAADAAVKGHRKKLYAVIHERLCRDKEWERMFFGYRLVEVEDTRTFEHLRERYPNAKIIVNVE